MIPQRVGSETAHLIFDPTGSDEVTVRYASTGVDAAVAAYDTPSGLAALASFFREMADEWKGWDGERRWSSLEGHIELSATHHRVVILRFEMSQQRFDQNPWRLSGAVEIEPGEQLSSIATGMDALFRQ